MVPHVHARRVCTASPHAVSVINLTVEERVRTDRQSTARLTSYPAGVRRAACVFPSYAAGCAAIEDRNAEGSPRQYNRAAREAVAGRLRTSYRE